MSTDEALEISRRQQSASELGPKIQPYTEQHPDEFAGIWMDNEAFVLTVAFTGHVTEHRAALGRLVDDSPLLKVVEQRFTRAELYALQERLSADRDRPIGTSRAIISHSGTSDVMNRIQVGVVAIDDEARRVLSERYGADKICVEPASGPGRGAVPGGGGVDVSPLPTTAISNGEDGAMEGQLAGDAACLWIEGSDGGRTSIRWPPGFGARFSEGGTELVDAEGDIVARTGDRVRMSGGFHQEPIERCDVGEPGSFVAGSVTKVG
jgi:hypothetical protein